MVKDNKNQTSQNKKTTKILVTAIVIGLLVCVAIPTAVYMHFSTTPDTTDTSSSVKKSSTKSTEVDSSNNQSDMTESMMTDSTTGMDMTTDTEEEELGLEEIDGSSSADMSMDNTMMSQSTAETEEQAMVSSESQENSQADDGEQTYTVQAQDNLYRIALNHGMTQQELMDLNGLTSSEVSVGQVLRVK